MLEIRQKVDFTLLIPGRLENIDVSSLSQRYFELPLLNRDKSNINI